MHVPIVAVGTAARCPPALHTDYSPVTVDRPPPPHEREWRHPAEISAEHRIVFAAEPPSRRLRTAALGSAGLAFVLIGALSLYLIVDSVGPEVATTVRLANRQPTVMAIPVDSTEDVALVSARGMAIADSADGVADGMGMVSLPDGRRVEAEGRQTTGDLVIVSINASGGARYTAMAPSTDMTMTLDGEHPPELMARLVSKRSFEELSSVPASIVDGTPVLDNAGNLIGLCSPHPDGIDLLLIDEALLSALRGD